MVDVTGDIAATVVSGGTFRLERGAWEITSAITMAPGSAIIGEPGAVLKTSGPLLNFAITMGDGCRLQGLTIDGDKASKPYHYAYPLNVAGDHCVVTDCTIVDPLSTAIHVFGSHNRLDRLRIANGGMSGIFLRKGYDNTLDDILLEGMHHFGVHASQGANRCTLSRLRTYGSGLELVALLEDTWDFRVSNCHAQGCGDNGFSIGGWQHVVIGNVARLNDHAGITLFGRDNIAIGNICEGNNRIGAEFPGILAITNFGSTSWRNIVDGNWSGDFGSPPKQFAGIAIKGDGHIPWAAGAEIYGSNPYRTYGNYAYMVMRQDGQTWPLISGDVPPTHTTGTWVDANGLHWRKVAGNGSPLAAKQNEIGTNKLHNNQQAIYP